MVAGMRDVADMVFSWEGVHSIGARRVRRAAGAGWPGDGVVGEVGVGSGRQRQGNT